MQRGFFFAACPIGEQKSIMLETGQGAAPMPKFTRNRARLCTGSSDSNSNVHESASYQLGWMICSACSIRCQSLSPNLVLSGAHTALVLADASSCGLGWLRWANEDWDSCACNIPNDLICTLLVARGSRPGVSQGRLPIFITVCPAPRYYLVPARCRELHWGCFLTQSPCPHSQISACSV